MNTAVRYLSQTLIVHRRVAAARISRARSRPDVARQPAEHHAVAPAVDVVSRRARPHVELEADPVAT